VKFERAMQGDDPSGAIIEAYRRVLAAIPYDIYEREEKKQGEAFYHALLLVMLWSSRIPTRAENHSYKGRSDVEIEYRGKVYIIELKTAEGRDACERAADEALEQIGTRGYADKYDPVKVTLIGLAVDKTERRIGAFRIEPAQ
ncbi:MAG: PD-(D/E)XK nuclease domain-containing protein, partial [Synergistaceae bacterium]|nr:PD-(D/E)XK nuclease domain-containing protein [Synergistaceae bacterium]